jgi:hypothetical protein
LKSPSILRTYKQFPAFRCISEGSKRSVNRIADDVRDLNARRAGAFSALDWN